MQSHSTKSLSKDSPANRSSIRIVVIGDQGTGKSSLIFSAADDTFPEQVPRVLPPTHLPADLYPDNVPVVIIDTPSRVEERGKLIEELKRADAVVATYACDEPATIERLSTYWLPEIRTLELAVPVIVVGCKLDLRNEDAPMSLEQLMAPIMHEFCEIETCIECSAADHIHVPEVFYYAQKAVLHPAAPIFDQESRCLTPRCVKALKRIFILCDLDKDGALDDEELNTFQVKCFDAPLQDAEISGVKRIVAEKMPQGINDSGLTLEGFLYLHTLFLEKGRIQTTWTVLRKYGYCNNLELSDDLLSLPFKRALDQSVELTSEAVDFLTRTFHAHDADKDGTLQSSELADLFSTAPKCPWDEAPYKDATEKSGFDGLSLKCFLSMWALMTLLNPSLSLANMLYIGYSGDAASCFHVTRKRSTDRKMQRSNRSTLCCYVFGPKDAGKSALLDSFLRRPFLDKYSPTIGERYACNIVNQLEGPKSTLVLREIPEDDVERLLSDRNVLAACDVAIFVYDSLDELSWREAARTLVQVVTQGEKTGFSVPCLLIASKSDLGACPAAVRESVKVCQEMGMKLPISVSPRLGALENIFSKIVDAARSPHLGIPETEMGRKHKQYHYLVNRSLLILSVGAAVGVALLAACRQLTARKHA